MKTVVSLLSWTVSASINHDTGSSTDVIDIESIVVSPDPPKPGENMTVEVRGTVKETIEVGNRPFGR